jgi:hypothetical protein
MGLTLRENGYAWDFQSALQLPGSTAAGTYRDKGFGTCHGSGNNW